MREYDVHEFEQNTASGYWYAELSTVGHLSDDDVANCPDLRDLLLSRGAWRWVERSTWDAVPFGETHAVVDDYEEYDGEWHDIITTELIISDGEIYTDITIESEPIRYA